MNLAFVESPVQLLNVLEWVHTQGGDDPATTTVVVLQVDPMSRGQLRRMAELARETEITVRWQEARGESGAPLKALRALAGLVRRADHIVIGDPFSRYVQLLLTLVRADRLTVVDDGAARRGFVAQLARANA
ncbi:Glycosyltransferase family 4 protein OS=Streptomyces tendae OX=1932 GN=F3L20_04260 PE=4 SV=1 [Streptomyces tendae]